MNSWTSGTGPSSGSCVSLIRTTNTAPTTTATPSSQPNKYGWNNSDVTVSLSAEDQGGSGVEKITYSASGDQTIEQKDAPGSSVDVKLDQEGTTTLTYYATDKKGNVEAPNTLTVKIDKSAPEVSSTNPPKFATGVPADSSISATFIKEGSGIDPDSITYSTFKVVQVKPTGNVEVEGAAFHASIDENTEVVEFSPSSPLARGLYRVTLTGVADEAGNVMPDYTWTFTTAGPPKK